MGFDKLEQLLKIFFETEASRAHRDIHPTAIRESSLREFSRRKKTSVFVRLWKSNWVRSATFGALILSLIPIVGGERSAGELRPAGLVEIVRDGEVFIATDATPLQIGDQILVGNNASAEIQMRHSMKTTAGNRTELRITNPNSLFLVRGDLTGDFQKKSSISTHRGQISGIDASLRVAVSDTGETHIQPRLNDVHVVTWDNQRTTLIAGEELRLRTDATLPRSLPQNLNLSTSQVMAIRAKLLIARTKALNALESRLNNNTKAFDTNLVSADRSFLSVSQVLKSSRDLTIVRRENLDLISRSDVVERIAARSDRAALVAETRAVQALLDIIERPNLPNFSAIQTDYRIYNRYILLQRLFAPLATNSRLHGRLLQNQYLEAAAKQITEAENSAAQINEILAALPDNVAARKFLQELSNLLSEDLASLLK